LSYEVGAQLEESLRGEEIGGEPAKEETILIYFVGTAGVGKSTLTRAFHYWTTRQKIDAIILNLDPGAEYLPYVPDIDVRDWVVLSDIMTQYGLGPNGAQVVCADMVAFKLPEILRQLEEFKTDYVLVDTPGQIELFAFRSASKRTIEALGQARSFMVFMFDPLVARSPSGLISQLLLSATVQFRLALPALNVLAKADILEDEELETILGWAENPGVLDHAINMETPSMHTTLSTQLFQLMETIGVPKTLVALSSNTGLGMEDIYNGVQQVFMGGENLTE
jgi:hypothetical protein